MDVCFVTSQYIFLNTQPNQKLPSFFLLAESFLFH